MRAIAMILIATVVVFYAQTTTEGARVRVPMAQEAVMVTTETAAPGPTPTSALGPAALVIQYRGGTNPCRFLFRSQRLGLFSQTPILIELVGATSERQRNTLTETNEGQLLMVIG